VQYGVALTYVSKELIAKAFAPAGPFHQTGYVHNVHCDGNGALRVANIGQDLQSAVGYIGRTKVGFYGAEREIRALGLAGTDTIEKGGFSDVRKPHDTAFKGHILYF
jgi:hypothetical protein